MRKSTYIWIIIVLITLNIATIVSVLYQKKKCVRKRCVDTKEIKMPNRHLEHFFRDELNLSEEQHAKFRDYRHSFHHEARELASTMQIERNQMLLELQKTNPDIEALDSLAKKLGSLHVELKHCTFEYYLNMKSLCNEEQQKHLFDIFSTMSREGRCIQMRDK